MFLNACSMGNKHKELEIGVHCRTTILLGSRSRGGMAPMAGALPWRDMGSLEGQAKETRRQGCPLCERTPGTH